MPTSDEAAARLPAGPLAVEWLGCELPELRAGTQDWANLRFRNAGTVEWSPPDETERGIWLSFHWLDRLGNAMVWEGHRTPIPHAVHPGEAISLTTAIRAPIPAGPYRLAFDLVDEGRCWFADVGNEPLGVDADVRRRLQERSLSVLVSPGTGEFTDRTRAALDLQEEPIAAAGGAVAHLAAGCAPRPDWSRRLLDAHDEGYAVVGGAIALHGSPFARRSARRTLAPWAPGSGRKPNWDLPLICPSIAPEIRESMPLDAAIAGLPSIDLRSHPEPWLYDGRIVIDLSAKAAPRADRPPV
ncbi:MAG: hypothetical protein ACR2OD_06485 [Gaiellaceae bacterium]